MADIVLALDQVSKSFRRGELHDSLRDLIPAITRRLVKNGGREHLAPRRFWALRDVSFEVARGEAFGIIGNNGAGKSTALKLLSGIMKPTSGTVRVNGRLSALIEVGAGFHPDLTGRENIHLNGAILGMTRQEIHKKFDAIVEFSGLAEFIDTPVKRYSSGMFARLGFSVAAHVEPDLLIVDEVLSVGDYAFQRKCLERMRHVMGGGTTVVFVSHNLPAVAEVCSRTLFLEHGRVVAIGGTGEVIKRYLGLTEAAGRQRLEQDVFISRVTVRSAAGERVELASGEKAWIDVEVGATAPCDKLALSLYLKDENHYDVFHTSTERLGHGSFALRPGQTFTCTFELDLHLARGAYRLGAAVRRSDTQKPHDHWFPATTLFATTHEDVGGVANLHPKVTRHEILDGPPPGAPCGVTRPTPA